MARPGSPRRLVDLLVILALLVSCGLNRDSKEPPVERTSSRSSAFLRQFFSGRNVRISLEDVDLPASQRRALHAVLARPDTAVKLPSLLVVSDGVGDGNGYRQVLRELAEVGYVVLGVDLPPSSPPSVAARALDWLRSHDTTDPVRSGVLGFSTGCGVAWATAVSERAQACVLVCDQNQVPALVERNGDVPPTLAVVGSLPAATSRNPAARLAVEESGLARVFRVEEALPGFILPDSPFFGLEASDSVWVEIYEFLGRHVEDAGPEPEISSLRTEPVLRVADIMRAVNSVEGVRGSLAARLENGPSDEGDWNLVRAQAALLTEAARILEQRPPPRGPRASWREKSAAYRAQLEDLLARVNERDADGARSALERLKPSCASCHEVHR